MKLAEFSVNNSLLVNLISAFILVVGLVAMFSIPLDMFPVVDYDVVTVTTAYPGAPAGDVERFVTIPIEKELKGISGIKDLDSTSDEGDSRIGITLDPNVSDKKEVVDEIRRAVDRVRGLPEGVKEAPFVLEFKSKERPILEVSVSGGDSELTRRQFAELLEDLLLDVPGVAAVRRIGWREREFHVEVAPRRLQEYYVSFDEVLKALAERNVTLPAGQIRTSHLEYNVRVTGEFDTVRQIEDVVIRANDAGNWLKIKDVARVVDTFEDETRVAKVDKKRAAAMVVVKSEKSDVVRVADKVKGVIREFRKTLPEGMEVAVTNDFSYYVKRRLGVLKNNGILGFILVVVTLFLFMHFVPAVVTALGIPFAVFVTLIVMWTLGMTVNLVSMIGLIIVLGMLVDDGIIVSENVYRYLEAGVPVREAVVRGTREVIAPVATTIVTTWAAFAPLLFMTDIIGKFIKDVPIVVIVALGASLFEVFLILPAHLADVLSLQRSRSGDENTRHRKKGWYQNMQNGYTRFLNWALDHRKLFIFGVLVPMLVSAVLLAAFKVKFVFFSSEGIEQFYVRAEAEKGVTLEKMDQLIAPVEDAVAALPPKYLEAFRTYLGSMEEEGGFDPNAKYGTHLGQITVFLTPFQARDKTAQEIADGLREKIKGIPGFQKLSIVQRRAGPPVGKSVEVAIKGDRFEVLTEIAGQFMERLNSVEGVSDVDTSYQFGKKELRVRVDEEKARQFYLTVGQIARAVRTAFKGAVATAVKPLKAEEEIEVVVRFREEDRRRLDAFEEILVENRFGKLVPLGSVAEVVEEDGVYTITHKDGKRVVHVTASVDEEKITSLEVNRGLQKEFADIPQKYFGYTVKFGGEFEKQAESRRNLLISFGIALSIIFIILTAEFKSLLQPFIVMLAIPFGLIGVIFAFFLHGQPLGFFALMGVVGLTGVVVNDSIVLVDFINRDRRQGKGRRQSIVEAGQTRLRPVLMTSVTTIVGLVGVAYGIGGGDPFLKPLALALIWGLFFSTALVLVALPCIYALMDDFAEGVLHRHLVKTRET